MEVSVVKVQENAGLRPVPRRDHTALLINKNRFMLLYGGKNDNAFSQNIEQKKDALIYLNDILLFDFELKLWTAVA